jgi:hypothetical protein
MHQEISSYPWSFTLSLLEPETSNKQSLRTEIKNHKRLSSHFRSRDFLPFYKRNEVIALSGIYVFPHFCDNSSTQTVEQTFLEIRHKTFSL